MNENDGVCCVHAWEDPGGKIEFYICFAKIHLTPCFKPESFPFFIVLL